jgi:hypothetical protein
MLGMAGSLFDDGAQTAFKQAAAENLEDVSENDVTISKFTDVDVRRLLSASIFPSSSFQRYVQTLATENDNELKVLRAEGANRAVDMNAGDGGTVVEASTNYGHFDAANNEHELNLAVQSESSEEFERELPYHVSDSLKFLPAAAGLAVDWLVELILEQTQFTSVDELFETLKSQTQTSASSGQFLKSLQSKSSKFASVTSLSGVVSNATVTFITNPPVTKPSTQPITAPSGPSPAPTSSGGGGGGGGSSTNLGFILGVSVGGAAGLIALLLGVHYYLTTRSGVGHAKIEVYFFNEEQANQQNLGLQPLAEAQSLHEMNQSPAVPAPLQHRGSFTDMMKYFI